MINKMEKRGYLKYSKYRGVKLTGEGLKIAKKITRKHRLLERFLHDILKLKGNVHDQACEMEHSLSDEAEIALCQVMEHPDTCPDDNEIIPACDLKFSSCEECMNYKSNIEEVGKRKENLIPLVELEEHQKAKVCFVRGDSKVLRRLMDMGITTGCTISLMRLAPLSGPVELAVRGSKLALGREIASNIFVEVVRCDEGD
jgi:DtxR family Mn-dependent transcriptional regulator